MKRAILIVLALAASLTLTGRAGAQKDSLDLRAYLEQIRNETGAPGVSLAIAHRGEPIFSGGAGFAELDNQTPQSGVTVHNVGSISKVMTVVALMELVEKGKVKLDDRIQAYVPSFPEKDTPITLEHILTHASGIRHYRDGEFGPHGLLEMRHYDSIEEAIEIFAKDPLLFRPGSLWSYSSHAYNLLQGVIEKASGKKFEAYMLDHVFLPAGMLASSFDVPDRVVHGRGRGYERSKNGTLVNSPYVNVSYKYASGGMLSTANDLVRFGMALNHGALLKPESTARMYAVVVDPVMEFRPGSDPVKLSFKQALGWRIDVDRAGRRFVSHTGTVRGTRSLVLNYPGEDLVVAMQANVLPFDALKYGLAIAERYLPPAHPAVSAVR